MALVSLSLDTETCKDAQNITSTCNVELPVQKPEATANLSAFWGRKIMDSLSRVLITGGAGFIGSHVTDRLVNAGFDVRIVDDLSAGKFYNIEQSLKTNRATFVKGNLADPAIAKKSVKDVDAVVHLAAVTSIPFSYLHPDLTFAMNVNATASLLNSCLSADVLRFVFVSSCSVYGEPSYVPIDENHPTCPVSPYAVSKLKGEQECNRILEKYGLDVVTLRLFNVYGSRQAVSLDSGVVSRFVDLARCGKPLVVQGDGLQTRDFINVSDVADLVLKVLTTATAKGEVFNIGSGQPTSVNNLAKTVLEMTDSRSNIVYEDPREGDTRNSYADISKAGVLLDFKPKVPLERGLLSLMSETFHVERPDAPSKWSGGK